MNASSYLVVFAIDGHRFALPLSKVDRVVRVVEITRLPDLPDTVLGVVNIHGQVVPVIDLRAVWGLPEHTIELSDQLVIAVSENRTVALLVDCADVRECASADIAASESIVPGVREVVKQADGVLPILELDALLSKHDVRSLPTVMGPGARCGSGGAP